MLDNMNIGILFSLSMQIDSMKIKIKTKKVEKELAIFFPHYRNKHVRNKCPLDTMEIYGICVEKHAMESFPFLPPLKEILKSQGLGETMEPLFDMN